MSVSYGHRLTQLAARHPDRLAVALVDAAGREARTTYAELERRATAAARLLEARGVEAGRTVVVALPNRLEHFTAVLGAWKLGACTLLLNPGMPAHERDALLGLVPDAAVVCEWQDLVGRTVVAADEVVAAPDGAGPLPERVPWPGKATTSGGSTGRPKIIVDPDPWAATPGEQWAGVPALAGLRADQTQLVSGSLYYNGPFSWAHFGLFEGHSLYVLERFDAGRALDLIEQRAVAFAWTVPTMLLRMEREQQSRARDLSSLEAVMHAGGPCPPAVKRAWIARLGRRLMEFYGASEATGFTRVDGEQWLERPGTVGRPWRSEVRIVADSGAEAEPDEVGEIYMRRTDRDDPPFRYIGAPAPRVLPGGWYSVGDLGWLDDAGWLYVADRRTDMIVTGGANVYPAEVEASLLQHRQVADAVVLGLADGEWGRRVHAVVQLSAPAATDAGELERHCRSMLPAFKVPKSFEFVDALPRDASLKIRRSAMVSERDTHP